MKIPCYTSMASDTTSISSSITDSEDSNDSRTACGRSIQKISCSSAIGVFKKLNLKIKKIFSLNKRKVEADQKLERWLEETVHLIYSVEGAPQLDNSPSLISNNDLPDINKLKHLKKYSKSKVISFYERNSQLDIKYLYKTYKSDFKGKISLKNYFAICDYCVGDHKILNEYIENKNKVKLTTHQKYNNCLKDKANNLCESLRTLKQKGFNIKNDVRLYRFTFFPRDELTKLLPGKIYKPHRFFSTSRGKNYLLNETDYFTARRPGDEDKVRTFFVIDNSGKYAADVQLFSKFLEEKEAIFLPSAKFKIKRIKRNADFLQVYMQCIRD